MDQAEIQSMFLRHMEEFQKEVRASYAGPDLMEKIHKALTSAFPNEGKAVGFAAKLAGHWEAFAPTLMSMAHSEEKQQELIEAMTRMLYDQVREFSRILTSDFPTS